MLNSASDVISVTGAFVISLSQNWANVSNEIALLGPLPSARSALGGDVTPIAARPSVSSSRDNNPSPFMSHESKAARRRTKSLRLSSSSTSLDGSSITCAGVSPPEETAPLTISSAVSARGWPDDFPFDAAPSLDARMAARTASNPASVRASTEAAMAAPLTIAPSGRAPALTTGRHAPKRPVQSAGSSLSMRSESLTAPPVGMRMSSSGLATSTSRSR
mmetsp:Transcript_10956/g.27780  ORF Transcript_10956/g.27780 Transcript_10956/m.27780 type:complete len:219 (+) Transcript_10956:503-1159(+)